MLSDRSYMRDAEYPRQRTSVLTWLIASILAVFVLQVMFIAMPLGNRRMITDLLGLSIYQLRAGEVWRLLTYAFVHGANPFHVGLNLLGLYFVGREVLPLVGPRRFLALFATAVLAGALAWSASNWRFEGGLVGASAGVMGVLTVYACFFPDRPTTVLLMFVPVTFKPKHLVLILASFELAGYFLYEFTHAANSLGVAHSSHLGGIAGGWLFHRFVVEGRWPRRGSVQMELPAWLKRSRKAPSAPAYKVNVNPPPSVAGLATSPADLRAEVDRILDKINSQGFGALTPAEKRRLDEARDLLSRR
jgi:membrane associated rhomboid family serine protease